MTNYEKILETLVFPSYDYDFERSSGAGYDIYVARDGSGSWVSDLGQRLEFNIDDGCLLRTCNVWVS